MKYFLSIVLLFLLSVSYAQQDKWYRVRIDAGAEGLRQLAFKGVAIDHGHYEQGRAFTGEFSERELQIIRGSGLRYEVLISDIAAWYLKQNQTERFAPASATFTTDCGTYATPVNMTEGSMGGFFTYAEMLAVLDSMVAKYPRLITARKPVSASMTTAEGRPLYYVKISDKPNRNDEDEPKVLYTALHHAREPQSLTQLVYFMWLLLENYTTNASVRNLLDSVELYFIPCINPDGYVYNATTNPLGGGYWRKNRRNNGDGTYGVDLNRNYGYKWGVDDNGSSPSTWSDVYRGPGPFSEPETKMIRNFCNRIPFVYAVNNHAYGNYLIYPFGFKPGKYTPDSAKFADEAALLAACNRFTTGTTIQTVGYTANGNSDDWMYGEQSTKAKVFAYTAETGDGTDGFWPRKSRIIPLSRANVDMNLLIAQLALQSSSKPVMTTATEHVVAAPRLLQVATFYNAPNPATTYTTVYFDYKSGAAEKPMKLVIVDATGKPVVTAAVKQGAGNVLVNTSSLQNGMYVYYLSDGNSRSMPGKLIVAH